MEQQCANINFMTELLLVRAFDSACKTILRALLQPGQSRFEMDKSLFVFLASVLAGRISVECIDGIASVLETAHAIDEHRNQCLSRESVDTVFVDRSILEEDVGEHPVIADVLT